MDTTQREALLTVLIAEDKDAGGFVAVLEALDTTLTTFVDATAKADEARTNFSASVLKAIQEAPSLRVFLAGMEALRGLYPTDDPRNVQVRVALTRCRRAFTRIVGEEDEAAWARAWVEKIRSEAREAPNFTRFERGAPRRPPAPAPYGVWPKDHKSVYGDFVRTAARAVYAGMLSEDEAQEILATLQEIAGRSLAAVEEPPTLEEAEEELEAIHVS